MPAYGVPAALGGGVFGGDGCAAAPPVGSGGGDGVGDLGVVDAIPDAVIAGFNCNIVSLAWEVDLTSTSVETRALPLAESDDADANVCLLCGR